MDAQHTPFCLKSKSNPSKPQNYFPQIPSLRATNNKVAKRGAFFGCEKLVAKQPQQPCNPPQTHHQNTTSKPSFFQNPPQKHQQTRKIPPQTPSQKKPAKS